MSGPLIQSSIPGFSCRRGKVRDVYDLGEQLVIIATDRISAFDWVMPTPIPGKGRILTELTCFWLRFLDVDNHLISVDLADMPHAFQRQRDVLEGSTMLVRKTTVIPFECVVRGYLAGSGWKDYRKTGEICGIKLPPGLKESDQLPESIFTPASKAESGHDENVSLDVMEKTLGQSLTNDLRARSIDLYVRAAEYARTRGVIIADSKFEWGQTATGEIILIDEVLTPDSSRFWPSDQYQPGRPQPSYDKQFVRDWLETTNWDKNSAPPALPEAVVSKTLSKYQEALEKLTRVSDSR